MDRYLNILQYNIQSLQSKKSLLQNLLIEKNIDVCLLNETWLKSNSLIPHFPSYNIVYKNSQNSHNGVAILVSHHLKYRVIDTHFSESIQNICIAIETELGPISILCVYSPPSIRFDTTKLKDLFDKIPKPCIIMGDFNAHNIAFGCRTNNNRGRCLYNIIDEFNLCILNDGSPTTVPYPNRQASAIDLALVNSSMAHLCDWYVLDDPMGSYHLPTLLEVNIQPSVYDVVPVEEKYIYSKANWNEYYSLSETCFSNLDFINDTPLILYDNFVNSLNDLRDKTIPKRKPKNTPSIQRKPVPWWNQKCTDSVKQSKDALKKYRSLPTMENWIQYKKLDAQKKKILKEERISSWHDLCASFNRSTPISRIWKYIKKFKKIGSNNHNKNFNNEWVPTFLDSLSDSTEINLSTLERLSESAKENYVNAFLNNNFSIDELHISLKSRRDTTPGLDNIPYMLIKKLHNKAQTVLVNIFNRLWECNIVPQSWKTQCVIPILKPNKPINIASSYRPISLSSCLGKLFENMLKLRLDYYAESNSLIPSTQFGFRKGKSCSESFVSFISDIKKVKLSHSNLVCVFLDVKGAFDNVNIEQLIQVLHDIGIPAKTLKWLYHFLSNRTVYVKHNNKLHGPKSINKGTMQGATLSPLLYNLYTSEIFKYVNTSNINILQFADDLVLYSIDRNIEVACNNINSALNQLSEYYSNKLKLEISSEKSSVLIFSKDMDADTNIMIVYNNKQIPIVKHHKFLGVIIDDKLKFDEHIKYICKNALKGINIIRHLAGTFWGSDPKIVSMLYKSIVRSHFDYSSIAYMNASPTLLRKLDVIQNMGLRLICGAMRSTPINSLEIETCIPPLALRRLQLAERFYLKVVSSDSPLVNKLEVNPIISQAISSTPLAASTFLTGILPEMHTIYTYVKNNCNNIMKHNIWPIYKCPFMSLVNSNVKYYLHDVHNRIDFLEFKDNRPNHYLLYTDGSKTNNNVMAAYFDPQLHYTKCIKIDNKCSIFTAESYAIYCALCYVKITVNTVNDILIVTDSKSVLAALLNVNITFKLNYLIYDIRKVLFELYNMSINVEFVWVPSHSGIYGNEVADSITHLDHDEDHTELMKVPFTDYYHFFSVTTRDLWKQYWDLTLETKGKWYAEVQKEIPSKPWHHTFKHTDRKFITTISRMRLGHCLTPAHLNRLRIVSNSRCKECYQDGADLQHIILECRGFNLQRLILASNISGNDSDSDGAHNQEQESFPRRVQDLLTNPKYFKPLYNYILNTVEKI